MPVLEVWEGSPEGAGLGWAGDYSGLVLKACGPLLQELPSLLEGTCSPFPRWGRWELEAALRGGACGGHRRAVLMLGRPRRPEAAAACL